MAALMALLSALQWGTADYVAGRLSRTTKVLVVLVCTQAIGLVAMLAAAAVTGAFAAPTGYLPWAVLASLAGASGLGLYYRALAIGTMGVVSPIAALGVLVPLAAGIAAGERPTTVQDLGIVVAIIGVLLASGPEVRGAAGWAPVGLAAGSAVLLGLALLGIARGSEVDVIMTMTAMRITTVSVLVPLALISLGRSAVPRTGWPALALVGLLDVGANLAFGAASQLGMLAIVAVLGSLYPAATIVLAWRLDGERLRAVQYLGVCAVLAGAAAISAG